MCASPSRRVWDRKAQRPLRLSREMRKMQGEFAANGRKKQERVCHPDRVGAGAGTETQRRKRKSYWSRSGVPPPRVFCKKRLDLLDCKGVDLFGESKEAASC